LYLVLLLLCLLVWGRPSSWAALAAGHCCCGAGAAWGSIGLRHWHTPPTGVLLVLVLLLRPCLLLLLLLLLG
jgi:hypothetical protein